MDKIQGSLVRLGSSTVGKGSVEYSVIEIGDRVLTGITTSERLSNFLSDGLEHKDAITIHLDDKSIVACEIRGKIYYIEKYRSLGSQFSILLGGVAAAFGSFLLMGSLALATASDKKDPSGFLLALSFLAFPIGGYVGAKWISKKMRPAIFKAWEAQGAIAV
jgi:hypothetical protein